MKGGRDVWIGTEGQFSQSASGSSCSCNTQGRLYLCLKIRFTPGDGYCGYG